MKDVDYMSVAEDSIDKSAMDAPNLDPDCDSSLYPRKDYHALYFGEIRACYETD